MMKKVILLFYYKLFSQCLLKIYILKPLWLHVLYNPFINFACQVFLLPLNPETRPIFVANMVKTRVMVGQQNVGQNYVIRVGRPKNYVY